MLHRREAPASGQKVFIAVAAYQNLGAGFTFALSYTTAALKEAGIPFELAIFAGNCHVDDSRNRLVRDFLLSDCTDLVFLDADLAWHASDFVKLVQYDRDIVAGIYPKKHGDDTYPVILFDGEIWSDRDGLIEVKSVPTGFLRIRRQVLQRLADEATHYNARNDADSAIACIFERQIIDGERWGGDYVFCRKARNAGCQIYIAPDMRFEHSGEHTWTGSVGGWLRQRNGIGLARSLKAFRASVETPEDAAELFDAWGNPFAATPLLLMALGMVARNIDGPILELGGGLSSLVLAASAPHTQVHVIEDNPIFAEQVRAEAERHGLTNLVMHCRPIKGGWYDLTGVPDAAWGLIFVDGPRRTLGGRAETPDRIDLSRSVVIADDVQDDGGVPELRRAISVTHHVQLIDAGRRAFAVCVPKPAALRYVNCLAAE
jgi:predicted O-methyltransferase YrrM